MNLYLHNKQIELRLQELAHEINDAHKYDDSKVVMVGVLTGGFMVFTEIIKYIEFPFECDFVRIKSYNGRQQGEIEFIKNIEVDIKNKHVYIIDDMADSGKTIQRVASEFEWMGAKTVSVVTLFKRKESHSLVLPVDGIHYNGFEVDHEWLVGFGLDDEQGYNRNLLDVYSI